MPRKKHSGISDQRKASIQRLEDARVLCAGGRWRGSMYMAGYAVECMLKYKVMQQWRCRHLEELEKRLTERGLIFGVYTHNLDQMIRVAGAWDRLRESGEA